MKKTTEPTAAPAAKQGAEEAREKWLSDSVNADYLHCVQAAMSTILAQPTFDGITSADPLQISASEGGDVNTGHQA
ncbi:MAG: hypothetical protein GY777_11120 [Candidatus Brocadiaceae bacterium]|nr:hypothetical protein [Candidatus Brocadiaceae bacterium]